MPETGQVVVGFDGNARVRARLDERTEIVDQQGGMRFTRWPEIRLDTEMDLHRTGGEPGTTASSEHRWLRLLGQPEHAGVKRPGCILLPCRHRELDVMN